MDIKSLTRALVLGGAIVFAGLAGGTGPLQAAGLNGLSSLNSEINQSQIQKVGHRHRRWKFRKFHKHGHGDGCGYYKWKWKHTGLFYWKKKYFICKGWW